MKKFEEFLIEGKPYAFDESELEKSGVSKDNWPLNNGYFIPCIEKPMNYEEI